MSENRLKCPGVGRDKDCISALQFYFSRKVTDDEMRFLHEVMQRTVACMPVFSKNCRHCNDTGMIAILSRNGVYAFAGPVPDDAKGYADADCFYCDSGRPPK